MTYAYAVYAYVRYVPRDQLSENFLLMHRGAVLFKDCRLDKAAFYAFYPLSAASYHLLNVDSKCHQGDMFWFEFCNDDYID